MEKLIKTDVIVSMDDSVHYFTFSRADIDCGILKVFDKGGLIASFTMWEWHTELEPNSRNHKIKIKGLSV